MRDDAVGSGIIALGASAGGLRSLQAVLGALGDDLPWPILISQHLSTDRESQLAEILARSTTLPVREAIEGEVPLPGTVYTCPGPAEMGITVEGRISLRPPMPGRPQRIDHLFATAAIAKPGRVIAVVLSGTGNDGAAGSLIVKLNGGMVIAESRESAEHGEMPAAAVRAGTVDATLPASDIARLILRLAQGGLEESTAALEAVLDDIARILTTPEGTDFTHYRKGTLRRRVDMRRAMLGGPSIEQYRDRVARDPAEREALVRALLIPVTQFFRDAAAWQALDAQVIPELAERAKTGSPVRIWCVGCATGEEAYSVAMLVSERIPSHGGVEILATDLDAGALATASAGKYDEARLAGVDPARRAKHFQRKGAGYQVSDALRGLVQFRRHDATRDPAPGKFDLIVCRNLLIYFDQELQARTIAAFHAALAQGGVLFLGRSETLPADAPFEPIARQLRIYRADGSPQSHPMDPHAVWIVPAASPREGKVRKGEAKADLVATNDELQAANEELAATNEELQAANEELASLNEEFQSSNQNLVSTNAEMQEAADAAQSPAGLLTALAHGRQDALVTVDASGRVTFYNRRAAEWLGMDDSRLRRPLAEAGLGLAGTDLQGPAHAMRRGFAKTPTGQPLDLVIERIADPKGVALGWVLTWARSV